MDSQIIVLILLAFFIASFFKGVTGLGFSTICLPILASFIGLKASIPLVILPSLSSNTLVMAQGGRLTETVGRFWPIYVSAIPGLLLGISVLTTMQSSISESVLGLVLIAYVAWTLHKKDVLALPNGSEGWLAGPVGFATGFVNGVTGSQVMPILPYLLSLRLSRETFVQAINVSFTLSSVVMLAVLSKMSLLSFETFLLSLIGIVPVACGISLGGKLRSYLSEKVFQRSVLALLLVIGFSLVLRSYI